MLKANGNAHLKTSVTGISQNSTAIYGSFSSLLIVKKSPHLIWGKDFAGFCYFMEGCRRNRVVKGSSPKQRTKLTRE